MSEYENKNIYIMFVYNLLNYFKYLGYLNFLFWQLKTLNSALSNSHFHYTVTNVINDSL